MRCLTLPRLVSQPASPGVPVRAGAGTTPAVRREGQHARHRSKKGSMQGINILPNGFPSLHGVVPPRVWLPLQCALGPHLHPPTPHTYKHATFCTDLSRSTSGARGSRRVNRRRMAARAARSGTVTGTSLSRRPGRRKAGSSALGRLVAAITATWPAGQGGASERVSER
jgi:hypothetical protein